MYMHAGMRVARRIPGGRDVYACESCRQRTVPCINNCGAGIVARGVMMWEEWLMSKSAPCSPAVPIRACADSHADARARMRPHAHALSGERAMALGRPVLPHLRRHNRRSLACTLRSPTPRAVACFAHACMPAMCRSA